MRLLVALLLVGCAHGSDTASRAKLATEQAAYAAALNDCYEKAKSYDAYERCASDVDVKYGVRK